MIVVLIVAGAVLYINLTKFNEPWIPVVSTSKVPVTDGWQINIVSISEPDVWWDDIMVYLRNGIEFVHWDIMTVDLDGGTNITASYPTQPLGALFVTLTITDSSGNGLMSPKDHLTVTANPAFSSTTNCSAMIVYEPILDTICDDITLTEV